MRKEEIIEAFENLRYFESTDEIEWGRVLSEADRAISALKKGVVQQREMLVAFADWLQYNGKWHLPEKQADNFLEEKKKKNE